MNLASLELALGDTARAVDLYRSGLERFERLAGADSPGATRCRSLLGTALHRSGNPAAAEALLRSALARQRAGGRPLDLADTLAGLGAALSDLGRIGEALPLIQEALALRLAALPAEHWTIAELRIELGGLLIRSGRPEEAREALAAGLASLETLAGNEWARSRARRFAAELAAPDQT
jgi:tetratricopeptide (TPR) repeat protein